MPKLKRGNVEVSAGVKGVSGSLGIEFDWEDNTRTKVKFNNIVKQANNLFSNLTGNGKRLYIFLDELELTLDNNKKYIRDKKLIRDLIIAIQEFNQTCKKNGFHLHLIAAIRSEVLTAVESSGKEINKIISDFATPIMWHQSGGNISNHPILQIIIKRLKATEKFYNLSHESSSEEIWKRYFPETIQNESSEKYLLHLTWYRPRDVIRILNIAKTQYPNSLIFLIKYLMV
ncbi:P-loop ATPase, Sll1717 family [Bacillus velezensis]